MPIFASISSRVTISGFSINGPFTDAMMRALVAQAYEGSDQLAAVVDAWLNDPVNAGKNIEISYDSSLGYAFRGTGQVFMNPNISQTLLYVTTEGKVVPHTALSILVHELGHAIGNVPDDPVYSNLKGVNIDQFVNEWYVDLNIPEEAGYLSRARTNEGILISGREYTEGNVIENAIVDRGGPYPGPVDTINTDFLGNSVLGPVLFVGSSLVNSVTGTNGDDYIYGGAGDDDLKGAGGADTIFGEVGNDIIDGGDGYDRAGYDFGSSGASIEIRPGADAFYLKIGIYEDTLKNIELVELTDFSDTVYINGIVENFGSERPTIALGAAADAFGADVVDATDADTGIYFNVGSGNIVGLDQATERGSWFGAASWLPTLLGATLGPTDLQITGAEEVFGSDYSDALIASSYNKTDLYGGDGNDFLFGRGPLANLWGEGGADVFHIGSNTVIKDAETTGDSVWMGLPIFGGTKQWWMEGNKAYWSPFSTITTAFPVIGSEILATASFFIDVATMKFASFQSYEDGGMGINIGYGLGGVAKIENYELDLDTGRASGGVVVFSATRAGDASSGFQEPNQEKFIQFINLALKAGFGVGFTGWDPIVLDLDGDGYELTTQRNSGVHFEFDGDGFAEKTGWVRPDDGFLVLDANGNGTVDDASEFFGDETQGGFVELAAHDLNLDGVIDRLDAVFADLRVWRDLNSDGVTDNGELFGLADLGIVSISLAAIAPEEGINIGGNVVAFESTFTLADGTVRKAGDVVLDISHIDTRYITDTVVSSAAAALPQLRGFGNVADLHIAMSEDAALLAQVQAFDALATSDLPVLKQAAEAILYAWANVDGVATDPIGANGFDARKLAFLEAFSGQEIAPRDPETGAVSTAGLAELEASWTDTLESLTLRLVVQSSSLPAFADMTYREDLDLIVMGSADTLKQAYSAILTGLSSDPATALGEWEAWGELLRAVQDGSRRFDNNIVRDDFAAAQLLAAIAETGTSFDLTTLAPALGITNLRVGTAGSDTLTNVSGGTIFAGLGDGDTAIGRGGQDVYLLESGFGDVVIDDEEGVQSGDRIRFIDLDRSDVSAARDGADLVLTVIASGDTVRVLGQFADVVPLSSDVFASNNRGIEEIQFADGTVMELPDIAIAVGEGTAGDDILEGTMHTDVLQGRAGNDLLMGGDDADLYVFDAGDGADIIRDQQTNPLLKAADMLIFGDDIAPEDLVWSRGSDPDDLVITIGSNGDSITIDEQFGYFSLGYNGQFALNSRIELFSFRHYGDVYTHKDIQQQLIASETTSGDDITRGFGDDDTFGASDGDDTLIGLDGNDTYFFGRGVGNDTIDEQAIFIDVNVGLGGLSLEMGADTVVFAPGIDPDDVIFARPSEMPDLVVTLDTGETLTIRNQFAGFQTGPLGAQWFDRIEWFEFGDGSRISWQDVLLDVTAGSDGDDSLWGDLYQDTLAGGRGNDYLSGGGYADTYIFNPGDGHDIVDDDNQFILGQGFVSVDTTPDTLRFGQGITSADVSLERIGNSLKLVLGDGSDSVTLKDQNNYYHTGVFGPISNSRIERVEFADGEVWTWQDLNTRAINDQTTAGDDIIEGFALEDRFEASAGDDIMRGGDSSDTYVFGIGSGSDRIEETIGNHNFDDDDRVEFTAGIALEDVVFERDGNDLTVRIIGTTDQLTIVDQWYNYVGFTDRDIETFHFADGAVITKAQIQTQLTTGTAGDDEIHGFHTDDTLVGGVGNDSLHGGDGSDTYIFNIGDGQDLIYEGVLFANIDDDDRLLFGAGIQPGDITLSRSGNDLTLNIDGTTDSVTIVGQFAFASWFSFTDVEFFEFADGTVWTKRDVSNFLMGGTSGDDVLVGTFENDELNGLAGNDILRGGDGADIYYFGIGYGQDTVEETVTNANLSDFDQIVFGEGITASDLIFTRSGDALIIAIAGTTDTITVAGQFDNYIGYTWYDIEQLQFVDGSIMTKEQIQALLMVGTSGDDEIIGFHTNDVLDGGPGNDILRGLDGSDTYLFGRGSGNDIIRESVEYVNFDDDDRIQFGSDLALDDIVWSRSGNDLIVGIVDTSDTITVEGGLGRVGSTGYTWSDIEFFDFADGTTLTKSDVQTILLRSTDGDDVIDGFWTSDILSGGRGNDLLQGAEGNDGYLYDIGDGHDVISDFHDFHGDPGDYIQFGAGIMPADVTVRIAANRADMVLSLDNLGGSLTLKNQVSGGRAWEIDFVRFADGTEWDKAQLSNLLVEGQATNGDDIITGTNANETFNGGAGNDVINASGGNDILFGGLGNDTLRGGTGQDRLVGGPGDDLLEGNEDNDTYVYNLGDGNDVINEWSILFGSFDTLEFGPGIVADDLRFAASGEHYVVTFAGLPGSITLNRQRTGGRNGGVEGGVNEFRFADGTVWNRAQIDATYLAQQRTDGNDLILGTNRADVIEGGAGNDTIRGGTGQDRLIGGPGNDRLEGNEDNDTYVYNLGDGDDIIDEWSTYYGSFDTLELGAGIAPADLRFAVSGESYIITFDGNPGSITLIRQRTGGGWGGIEGGVNQFRFADGTIWDRAQIDTTYLAQQRTDGDDLILGTNRADVIEGGAGADTLRGGTGQDRLIGGPGNDRLEGNEDNDTYVYNLGDGDDVIDEWVSWYGSFDTLEFGPGISASDLRFAVSGESYIVTFDGNPGSITLIRQRTGGGWGGIEGGVNQFRFADGTIWDRTQIDTTYLAQQLTDGDDLILGTNRADVIEGGAGADTLRGGIGQDRLIGGPGNDRLEGNEDNDTYVYNLGDGDDIIDEWVSWYGSFDTLEFGAGIAAANLRFAVSGEHYVVTFEGHPGSVTLLRQRTGGNSGGNEGGINQFRFADGTVWNRAQIDAAYLANQVTDGDDNILGTIRNDEMTGGLGNDILNGSSGTDIATYSGLQTEYSLITGGGTFQIRDDRSSLLVNEGIDTLISIETLRFGNGQTVGITSPIILDLDGDGIQTLSASESSARFDLNGDGLADNTSWIGAGDAFLYLDRDGDGTMSGVEEISFVDDVPNAATDLAGLAAFDTNEDGILDERDARFAEFGVWRDADGDGAVDEGEPASLATVGIRSINLAGTPVDAVTEFGEVAIANTGTFTLTNGATRSFADAALTYFSAATNLPSLAATTYDFDRKTSKFRIAAAGGALTVTPRRARSGMDPLAGQLGANTVLTFSNGTFGMFAPVVLDLDGDGVELVSRKKSRASFDYAGDGTADDTGWIGRNDGFLVIDRNNDGMITEAAELSLASEDEDARGGLQGLARLDSNGDGTVNDQDARFGELRVWQDRNADGRTDAGELLSLEEAGIVAIRLSTVSPTQASVKLDRNVIAATTSFMRANGTTSTAADVSLAYRPVPASAAPSTSLAPAFDLLGPDLFLAPRRDGSFASSAFVPSVGNLMEMLGAANSQGIADLFDRVAADGERASSIRQSALTVMADFERQLMSRQRVFDPASTYFMMFQPFQPQVGPELVVELLDVDHAAAAPAFAATAPMAAQGSGVPTMMRADNSSAIETPEVEVALNASQELVTAEPVVQQAIGRTRLDPAQHEVWGGPARVSALPSAPGEFVEVTMPPSHVLQPKVDLAVMLAQPGTNDTAPDADIARKLAMIRQDMNSFGVIGTGEGDRLRQHEPDSLYLHA